MRGCVHLLLVLPVWTTLQVHRTVESPTHTAPSLLPGCSGRFPGPRQTVQRSVASGPGHRGCGKGAGRGWNRTCVSSGVCTRPLAGWHEAWRGGGQWKDRGLAGRSFLQPSTSWTWPCS